MQEKHSAGPYAISVVVGAAVGVLISVIVNLALVEITISPFFATYFGIIFIVVGSLILWRVLSHESENPLRMKKAHLAVFASLILLSGVLCFFMDRHSFAGLQPLKKVPLYMILGLAVAFAMTFTVIDLVNYFTGFTQNTIAKPVVESPQQVYLVLAVSVVMGLVFGFTFGVLDVEDESKYALKVALLREENYCYPMGFVVGALSGFGNEYYRQNDHFHYKGLGQTEFDEDL